MNDTPETNSIIRNAQAADHPPTRLAATLTVKCEKLERERDEAREHLDNMQDQRDFAMKVIKRLEQERDEARAALMRIEDLFINCTDIYEDFKNMGMIAKAALEETK